MFFFFNIIVDAVTVNFECLILVLYKTHEFVFAYKKATQPYWVRRFNLRKMVSSWADVCDPT